MKPLPFELPAVIQAGNKASAERREEKESGEKSGNGNSLSILTFTESGQKNDFTVRAVSFADCCGLDFSELMPEYERKLKASGLDSAKFFMIDSPRSLTDARAALLASRNMSAFRTALISFKIDEEGMSEFGTDALALYVIAEGMGAAAFGLESDASDEELLNAYRRIAPYAQIPLIAAGDFERIRIISENIPQIGLAVYKGERKDESQALFKFVRKPVFNKRDRDLILAASGAEAFFVDPTIDFSRELECDSDFPENILGAEDEGGGLKIYIRSIDDVDILEQYQYMINRPLSICAVDPVLLEAALKVYNGRAFYDGTCGISDKSLDYLQNSYGLIVL